MSLNESSAANDRATDGAEAASRFFPPRVRGVIAGVAILVTAVQAGTTAVLVVGAGLAALAMAVVVRPAVRDHWAFGVALGVGAGAYGAVYALTVGGTAGLAVGALLVTLGTLTTANHLGVAPWSDRPRQI